MRFTCPPPTLATGLGLWRCLTSAEPTSAKYSGQVQKVLVDGGYRGKPFALAVEQLLGATVQVAQRHELHTFVVLPKRWVVERSFAWLDKCRRLWKNCERKLNTSLQMVVLACTALILRRL